MCSTLPIAKKLSHTNPRSAGSRATSTFTTLYLLWSPFCAGYKSGAGPSTWEKCALTSPWIQNEKQTGAAQRPASGWLDMWPVQLKGQFNVWCSNGKISLSPRPAQLPHKVKQHGCCAQHHCPSGSVEESASIAMLKTVSDILKRDYVTTKWGWLWI